MDSKLYIFIYIDIKNTSLDLAKKNMQCTLFADGFPVFPTVCPPISFQWKPSTSLNPNSLCVFTHTRVCCCGSVHCKSPSTLGSLTIVSHCYCDQFPLMLAQPNIWQGSVPVKMKELKRNSNNLSALGWFFLLAGCFSHTGGIVSCNGALASGSGCLDVEAKILASEHIVAVKYSSRVHTIYNTFSLIKAKERLLLWNHINLRAKAVYLEQRGMHFSCGRTVKENETRYEMKTTWFMSSPCIKIYYAANFSATILTNTVREKWPLRTDFDKCPLDLSAYSPDSWTFTGIYPALNAGSCTIREYFHFSLQMGSVCDSHISTCQNASPGHRALTQNKDLSS